MLDPFAGSGTTLVQALESGHDSAGVDVAAFNCLLMRVKTRRYDPFALEHDLRDALRRFEARRRPSRTPSTSGSRRSAWAELRAFRSLAGDYEHADVLRVILARAARSARLTTHFDLDFPQRPAARPVLVLQAPPRVPAGRARRALPPPVHARHARAPEGVRAAPHPARRGGAPRRRARARAAGPVRRGRHLAAVSGADRLPRAAPLRVRAARPGRPAGARARRRRRRDEPGRASPRTSRASPPCSERSAAALSRARRC